MKAGEPSNAAEMDVSAAVSGSQRRRVLVIASGVLWFVGLIALLSFNGGWFGDRPILFYEPFPGVAGAPADAWRRRMTVNVTVGLSCWFVAGLLRVAGAISGGSPKVRSAWTVFSRLLVGVLTFFVFVSTAFGLLIFCIDVSGIPQ